MSKHYNYDTGAFRGYCTRCGMVAPKRNLIRLLCRKGPYRSPKGMAYLCDDCMAWLVDTLAVELPDMEPAARREPRTERCPYSDCIHFGKNAGAYSCDDAQVSMCRRLRAGGAK